MTHAEKHKEYYKQYRAANKERFREINNERAKKWAKDNKIRHCQNRRLYDLHKKQAHPSWANARQIENIYKVRDLLNVLFPEKRFEVDHIVPLRGKNVCGLHVEDNLQILPKIDNTRKNNYHHSDDYSPASLVTK